MDVSIGSMVLGSVISAAVSAVFGVAQYYGIQRRESRRDKELDSLQTEVKTLRDGKVQEIERRLDGETRGRKAIHEELANFNGRYVTRDDCEKHHRMDREQRADESRRFEKGLDRQTAAISELAETVAGLSTSVKLLIDDKIKHEG